MEFHICPAQGLPMYQLTTILCTDIKEAFASLNRFGIILLSREFEWRGDHDKSIGNVPKREGQEV